MTMKRKKTPKMSRIRVAAFKKRMKLLRIKKHPKCLASLTYKKTVTNCTIPEVDKDNLTEDVSTWNPETKVLVTKKDSARWDAGKWYKDIREAAKKAIREATHTEKNRGEYKYFAKRKKPWYMLDTRKRYRYEERKYNWGTKTDWFRVPSEAEEMYNRTLFRPNIGKAWKMEQVVQHKIAKWEKKNPCPVSTDQNPPDIFETEYMAPWKAAREAAIERIRDFVVSMYDKLPLTGRFQKTDNEFVEEKIADLKDVNGDGHKINEVDPKKSKLLKKAQKVTNKVRTKRNNLVCTNLRDHMNKRGRIILPAA